MREHHRRMIRYSLDHLRFLEEQLGELDQQIRSTIEEAGFLKSYELLQTIPGVHEKTAATMLAEVGPDVSSFPSEKKLSSWAGVCPGNNRSAGKDNGAEKQTGTGGCRSVPGGGAPLAFAGSTLLSGGSEDLNFIDTIPSLSLVRSR
jgi:transposase